MKRRFFAALRMTILTVAVMLAGTPRASAQFATFDASNLAQAVLSFLQDGDNMVLNTEQFLQNLGVAEEQLKFLREMDSETSSESADGTSQSFDTSSTMASEAEVNISSKPKKGLGARIWQGMKDAFSAIVSIPVYSIGSVLSIAITLITKIVQWILTAVSAIYLIILGLVGPIVFALSLMPGFRKGIHNWVARYIQISFWCPMAALVDYVNYKITGALVVTMFNNPSLNSGAYTLHLIVLELITLVCLLGVPSMASWVISSAGAGDLNRNIASTAQKAVMIAGKL